MTENMHKITDKIVKQYSLKCALCQKVIIGKSVNQCDVAYEHHYHFKHMRKVKE